MSHGARGTATPPPPGPTQQDIAAIHHWWYTTNEVILHCNDMRVEQLPCAAICAARNIRLHAQELYTIGKTLWGRERGDREGFSPSPRRSIGYLHLKLPCQERSVHRACTAKHYVDIQNIKQSGSWPYSPPWALAFRGEGCGGPEGDLGSGRPKTFATAPIPQPTSQCTLYYICCILYAFAYRMVISP